MDLDITNEPARVDSRVTSQHDAPSREIAFTTGQSTLGTVLVGRSARGICAILIGSEAGELTADLAARFPESALVQNDERLDGDLEKILRFIETPARGLDLELDIHGTPFQRRVWDALCGIPSGRTVTYAALARRIGEPGSARAVAMPALPTPLRLRSRVTGLSGATARSPATAGAKSANVPCSHGRRWNECAFQSGGT
jgi:O6-methylguanine-DNA--protein-cysteine methyltransferase